MAAPVWGELAEARILFSSSGRRVSSRFGKSPVFASETLDEPVGKFSASFAKASL